MAKEEESNVGASSIRPCSYRVPRAQGGVGHDGLQESHPLEGGDVASPCLPEPRTSSALDALVSLFESELNEPSEWMGGRSMAVPNGGRS